ncbi:N-acetyl-gamma-glutamyl-phosphate reductase [Deinobacterium chartae]|uniref:N-acetyl-gamma-glutamyl-phosphate reductase n=1 Tax=Deinobacterium chartae TaxID=521158 RepID=A0A841I511_9DEIO|nr:N-acetyl-gamma-glutamyl-phosphate reductase [Deinobacterium chartae]MBB6099042.1 N-acetyl-gamma-glutamyl-phosphate reductase [Deinobacterium chartae]
MTPPSTPARVGIIGANGYGGGELSRLLSRHPGVELVGFSSRQFEGQPFRKAWPNADLEGTFENAQAVTERADIVFLALPNGLAMDLVPPLLAAGKRVIDLSADYRLPPEVYAQWYGKTHTSPELCAEAVYGLPELNREALRAARLVANPGCYVTATALALAPLARAGLIEGSVIVDGISGISGAGRNAAEFSFAEANENVQAYKVAGTHRHTAEMEANLARAGQEAVVTFTPHVAPYTRGILVTAYATPARPVSEAELLELYRAMYADEPFVQVLEGELPTPKAVSGSNRCDVAVRFDARARRIVAFGAIDNLMKGMAGEAVQNLNLMLGLEETLGLPRWGMWP